MIRFLAIAKKTQTVDEKEINHFKNLKDIWWNENGPTNLLLKMNKLRIPFVKDGLIDCGAINEKALKNTLTPLENVRILDVGCGGNNIKIS